MMRCFGSQSIELGKLLIPLHEQLAVPRSQLAESNLASDEDFTHLVVEHCAVSIEDDAEILDPSIVADVGHITFELARYKRGRQDAHVLPSGDKAQPEVVFHQSAQRLVESAKRMPCIASNGKHWCDNPRVRQN